LAILHWKEKKDWGLNGEKVKVQEVQLGKKRRGKIR